MHAHMGMKVEEWEDGQVNIGIAVCPQRKGGYTVGPSKGENTPSSSLSPANTPYTTIPTTAFVIRPPENYQSQGGINITYAHHTSGKSDLIIMLNPESQGHKDKISFIQDQIREKNLSTDLDSSGIKIKRMGDKEVERKEETVASAKNKVTTTTQDQIVSSPPPPPTVLSGTAIEEVSKNFPDTSGYQEKDEQENQESNNISRESSCNHTSPQEALSNIEEEEAREMLLEKDGSPTNEDSLTPKKSGNSVKRVSWVEDCEKFVEDGNGSPSSWSRNNSKENKRESVRKSNGTGNYGNGTSSNRSSPMRKYQNGYSSPPDDAASLEGYTMTAAGGGKRNSGDKSRIPSIATNGDYQQQPTCDYYRRKMLRECLCNNNPPNFADNWYGYSSLQRYAGQKVVKKITAEQKRIEEDISNRRKTEIWILGNDMDDFFVTSPQVPLRKKTTRLKPIHIVQ